MVELAHTALLSALTSHDADALQDALALARVAGYDQSGILLVEHALEALGGYGAVQPQVKKERALRNVELQTKSGSIADMQEAIVQAIEAGVDTGFEGADAVLGERRAERRKAMDALLQCMEAFVAYPDAARTGGPVQTSSLLVRLRLSIEQAQRHVAKGDDKLLMLAESLMTVEAEQLEATKRMHQEMREHCAAMQRVVPVTGGPCAGSRGMAAGAVSSSKQPSHGCSGVTAQKQVLAGGVQAGHGCNAMGSGVSAAMQQSVGGGALPSGEGLATKQQSGTGCAGQAAGAAFVPRKSSFFGSSAVAAGTGLAAEIGPELNEPGNVVSTERQSCSGSRSVASSAVPATKKQSCAGSDLHAGSAAIATKKQSFVVGDMAAAGSVKKHSIQVALPDFAVPSRASLQEARREPDSAFAISGLAQEGPRGSARGADIASAMPAVAKPKQPPAGKGLSIGGMMPQSDVTAGQGTSGTLASFGFSVPSESSSTEAASLASKPAPASFGLTACAARTSHGSEQLRKASSALANSRSSVVEQQSVAVGLQSHTRGTSLVGSAPTREVLQTAFTSQLEAVPSAPVRTQPERLPRDESANQPCACSSDALSSLHGSQAANLDEARSRSSQGALSSKRASDASIARASLASRVSVPSDHMRILTTPPPPPPPPPPLDESTAEELSGCVGSSLGALPQRSSVVPPPPPPPPAAPPPPE